MRRGYRSFQFLFRRARRTAVARLGAKLLGDRRGAVALYAAFVGAVIIGGGVLVIDIGRLMVFRAEMQDAADSAALSAVIYLDGTPGAIARATAMAQAGVRHASAVKDTAGNITVATITFFQFYDVGGAAPRGTPVVGLNPVPADDAIAAFIQVELTPETMTMLLQPVLAIFGSGGPDSKTYTTYAVAENAGGIQCGTPPIMVCDPVEGGGPSLLDPNNVGRMMIIKEGPKSAPLAPGQFNLLCTLAGDCGASAISDALRSPDASQCGSGDDTVTTAPGSKTNMTLRGINARFDIFPPGPAIELNPATSVYDFPDDDNMAGVPQGDLGNGNWDYSDYWNVDSDHVNAYPAGILGANPTRYQVYLYEIGASFYINGKQTAYPTSSLDNIVGWTLVNGVTDIPACPFGTSPPCRNGMPLELFDGLDGGIDICPDEYANNAECQAARRNIQVAVLPCVALGVQGSATYSAGGRYVNFFITQDVEAAPDADIHAELIGAVYAAGGLKGPGFSQNVRLVE